MTSSSMQSSQQSYVATSSSSSTTYSSSSVSFNSTQDVKKAFCQFDSNGDGHLDRNEIKNLLTSCGKKATDQEIEQMFKQGDADGDGMIDIQEFTMLMFPAAAQTLARLQQSYNSLNDIIAAFRKNDADGDGHIDRKELRAIMSQFSEQDVDSVFALGDKDQSGGIDYQEFISMMMPNANNILMAVAKQFNSVQSIKEGFMRIDANADGSISRQELKGGLRLADRKSVV